MPKRIYAKHARGACENAQVRTADAREGVVAEVEAGEGVAALKAGHATQEIVRGVEVAEGGRNALEPLDRIVGEVETRQGDVGARQACKQHRLIKKRGVKGRPVDAWHFWVKTNLRCRTNSVLKGPAPPLNVQPKNKFACRNQTMHCRVDESPVVYS